MKAVFLGIVASVAMACGHGGGDGGISVAEGAQSALAFAVIVFPILRVLAIREDNVPPPER